MKFAIDCVVKFIGIQGEKCTNLRLKSDCSTTEFLCFPTVTSANSRWVSQIRPRPFPST